MALQIWLPLNGNLNNNGIANTTITSTNTTMSTNGKLGSCLSFNNTGYLLGSPGVLSNSTNDWTFACWMKVNAVHNGCLFSERTTVANTGITIFYYSSTWMIDDGARWQFTPTNTIATSTWYHVCVVRKKGVGKYLYINGSLDSSTTTTGTPTNVSTTNFSIGSSQQTSTTVGGNQFNGYLNDVRVYDHALSAEEIKDLARGLVIHYPLNREGFGQDNLLSRYVVPGQNNPTNTSTAGRTTYYGDYGIIIPAAENADTYFRLFLKEQLVANETYTISCQVSGLLEGSFYRFPLFGQGNTSMGMLQLNHNGLCSLTFTMTYSGAQTAVTTGSETVYILFMDDAGRSLSTGQGPITVTNFKIEKGSVATPWVPATTDPMHDKLCVGNGIVNDVSGNGYHASNSTITYSSDTPSNNVSAVFDETTRAYIGNTMDVNNIMDQITVAFWLKRTNTDTTAYRYIYEDICELYSYYTSGNYRLRMTWTHAKSASSYAANTSDMGINIPLNEWRHFVWTFSGGYLKTYVNGKYNYYSDRIETGQFIKPRAYHYLGSLTSNASIIGGLSDFRIYATALSDDDVLKLYNGEI